MKHSGVQTVFTECPCLIIMFGMGAYLVTRIWHFPRCILQETISKDFWLCSDKRDPPSSYLNIYQNALPSPRRACCQLCFAENLKSVIVELQNSFGWEGDMNWIKVIKLFVSSVRSSSGYKSWSITYPQRNPLFQIFQILQILK